MSNVATIEEEVRQLKRAEIDAFEMPRPCMGQCVAWYPSGTRLNSEIAFITRVSKKNVELQRASGTYMTAVRHIDDPKLQLNEDQRESGAWDFTEQDKKQLVNEKRIETLAELVTQ